MPNEESIANNGNLCSACKANIAPGATKCSHCGSFQNWRRYLSLSTVVLSLLVALISVLTVGVSLFKDTIIPKRANIDIAILQKDGYHTFKLLIRNAGNAPGLIRTMHRPLVWQDNDWDMTLVPYDSIKRVRNDWPIIFPENSIEIMMVKGRLRSPPDYSATEKKYGCKVEFIVLEATGIETRHEVSCTE